MGIYLLVGDNSGKLELIPHNIYGLKWASIYKLMPEDEPALD